MPAFSGFPNGYLRATVVPSLFFAEVLGDIEDPAELKVILYLFWRLGTAKRYPRFVTRRELEGDAVVHRGLAAHGPDALSRGLEQATQRGVIIHRRIELGERAQECYFLNTGAGRRWVRDLESGRIDLGQVVQPIEPDQREGRPNIFRLYEENVGLLTPLVVEELKDAERRYPGEWIEDAFREAVAYNRRSWRYVQRILQRWETEGRSDGPGDETSGRRDR
jgi:DnaD/phage-associated family protein